MSKSFDNPVATAHCDITMEKFSKATVSVYHFSEQLQYLLGKLLAPVSITYKKIRLKGIKGAANNKHTNKEYK